MSKQFYEDALADLWKCHSLPSTALPEVAAYQYPNAPLQLNTPVYCQWMDMNNPDMHGRWLPGVIGGCQQVVHPGAYPAYFYHIVFDNKTEMHDVHQYYVVKTEDYHHLTKVKYDQQAQQSAQHDGGGSSRSVGELYGLFKRLSDGNHETESNTPQHQQHHHPPGSATQQQHQEGQTSQLDLLFTAADTMAKGDDEAGGTATPSGNKRGPPEGGDINDGPYKRHAV